MSIGKNASKPRKQKVQEITIIPCTRGRVQFRQKCHQKSVRVHFEIMNGMKDTQAMQFSC